MLMLNDPARLTQMLNDPAQPIQIIVAGKAHPADEGGKALIQQMVQFSDLPDVRHRIVFLPDYDMAMARTLVQGCDVWLNNPLPPLEACGTSGMKAALNGGLNLSTRYDGANGWEIPSADGVPSAWVEQIRHSLRSLGPLVQADRMVIEYVTQLYRPTTDASMSMADASGRTARDLAAWKRRVRQAWPNIRIQHIEAEAAGMLALGFGLTVRVLDE
jgi:starch phosphorylase